MNQRSIEKLIPKAIESAEKNLAENGKIAREYNGYISSFGASVLQSGPKAAIAFYERNSEKSAQDKNPLMQAILYLLPSNGKNYDKLFDYALANDNKDTRDNILNAVAALKLAIRTFNLEQGES